MCNNNCNCKLSKPKADNKIMEYLSCFIIKKKEGIIMPITKEDIVTVMKATFNYTNFVKANDGSWISSDDN